LLHVLATVAMVHSLAEAEGAEALVSMLLLGLALVAMALMEELWLLNTSRSTHEKTCSY
jgi:Tfp pilus assembly protein PilV